MEIKKQNKLTKFFKKYGYYMVAGALVVAIGLTVGLTIPRASTEVDPGGETPPVNTEGIKFGLPMEGATVLKGFSDTELQYNGTLNEWSAHFAVDLVAGDNLAVYAIADGTVKSIEESYLEGTTITIEHKEGYVSIYKSLDNAPMVKVGDKISLGSQIGNISDTASSEDLDGKHLHLEMTKDGKPVDPSNYLELESK